MKRIGKAFLYLFGTFLSFVFGQSNSFAQFIVPMYGVEPPTEPTFWEKILLVILSPIFVATIALALIVGIVILIKRKRKNAKKGS